MSLLTISQVWKIKTNKFKDNLKMLRQEAKMGQVELAKALGVGKGTISL